ncbi:MAG: hypothetical protein FWE67_11455, partial [Planctomycetaceae bacterium]|nr:hypothetical protein [Planctomycetaceae bacterium]
NIDLARGSQLRAGRQVQVDFGDMVNVRGVNWGNDLMVTPEGKIRIVAEGDVTVAGQVSADAVPGANAGQIDIRAGNDIRVQTGAAITARGAGANSDGGEVVIFADRNSYLQDGAVADVSAKNGKGGFLEFSAKKVVDMVGDGLRSSSGGTVLIDPETINWTGNGKDVYTNGADYTLDTGRVIGSITLNDIYISTRNVVDAGLTGSARRNAHLNNASQGNSGNIVLKAEYIDLDNVTFLSYATGNYNAGSIGIFKYDTGVHTRGAENWSNNVFDAHAENGKAGNIAISVLSEGLTINGTTFNNEATAALNAGSLRFGSMSSLTSTSLGEGGTFTFNNSSIITGDFLVKGAHPDGSDMTNSVEGQITISGSTVLANRIYIESEEDISILGSKLTTRKVYTKNSVEDAPDIVISILRNDADNRADVAVKRTSTIIIDKNSEIEGNDILVQAVVTAGTHMEVIEIKDENGKVIGHKVVNDNGDEVDYNKINDGIGDTVSNLFTETLPNLLSNFMTPVLASFRGYDIDVVIDINGKLTAENSIDVSATAAAMSSAFDLGIAGIAVNVGVVLPTAKITIGPDACLVAKNGDICIESVVLAGVSQSTFNLIPVNANPIGVVVGVGVVVSRNEIDVQAGAVLEALKGNIRAAALTERSVTMSASGGKGNDSFAATIAFVYEEADTHVTVGGKLTAVSAEVLAVTNVLENTLSAKTVLGQTWMGGGVNTFDYFVPAISGIKTGIFGLIKKISGKDLGTPDDFRDFGAGLSTVIMVDNNDTSAIISGTANITVRYYLAVEALTHDVPVGVAVTTINPFVLNEGGDNSTKKTAFGISVPVLVILQNTNAEIQSGAIIHSGSKAAGTDGPSGVIVNAVTELPYNLSHPVAQLILTCMGEDGSFDKVGQGINGLTDSGEGFDGIGEGVSAFASLLLNNNLGLDDGLFNTWSQTSIESEDTAVSMMLSVVYSDIESIARVGDNVTISGLTVGNPFGAAYNNARPDLSVTAYTDIQMSHVVGNMRSFLRTMPNAKASGVATTPQRFTGWADFKSTYAGGMTKEQFGTKAKQSFGDMFQSMWGNESSKGVGAGIMFNWFDSTAVAEIGAATLDVNNINVAAETTGFDLLIGAGASKTDEWGANGTVGASVVNVNNVDQIKTGIDGDLYITVLGSILDKNTAATPDPLSDAEASDLWTSLGLIKGTAEFNANAARKIAAYENEFTQLYFDAWKQAEFDAANYEPDYVFRYTDAQRTILVNSLLTEEQIAAEEQKRTALYHDAFKTAYNANYRYTASDAEKLALTENMGWTEKQLKNAFDIPMFILTQDAGSRNNTTSLVEEPNFIGRNISLSVTGSIGSQENNDVVIPFGISSDDFAANDVWRRSVSDAEWDDVTFGTTELRIKRYDDINIAASGWLKTESKNGATYLGSQNDVTVNEIVSGSDGTKGTQPLRFKIDGSMIPMIHQTPQPHIYALNAVLEAAGGTLGSGLNSSLVLNLTGGNAANGWITARGTDGVFLKFADAAGDYANAYVREIGSQQGTVSITAWSIIDAQPNLDIVKIAGKNLFLNLMGGSIGTQDSPMLVSQQVGGVSAFSAGGDIFVCNPKGPLDLIHLEAGGNVGITAYLNLTVTDNFTAKGNVLLESIFGKLLLTDAIMDIAGNAVLLSASDVKISGGSINTGGTLELTAASNIFVADTTITSGDSTMNAQGGNLTVSGSAFNLNTLTAIGSDISLADVVITIAGMLRANAANNLSVMDSDITAGETALHARNGNWNIDSSTLTLNSLTASGGDILFGNSTLMITGYAELNADGMISVLNSNITTGDYMTMPALNGDVTVSGSGLNVGALWNYGDNVSFADSTLSVAGTLTAISLTALSLTNSNITAGDTNLTATNGNLTIFGGTANLGNTRLTSGGNISVTDWLLTAETLDMSAGVDISITGSTIAAGNTTLGAASGSIFIDGIAGSLPNRKNIDFAGLLRLTAANDIFVTNVNITAGDMFMIATTGDLTLNEGSSHSNIAELTTGGNFSMKNWLLVVDA